MQLKKLLCFVVSVVEENEAYRGKAYEVVLDFAEGEEGFFDEWKYYVVNHNSRQIFWLARIPMIDGNFQIVDSDDTTTYIGDSFPYTILDLH